MVISGPHFLKNVVILSDFASNILPEGLLFKPEGLLSNLEYEEMSAEDDRNAKRRREEEDDWLAEPSCELGFRRIKFIMVSSLGPILKKRFVCAM